MAPENKSNQDIKLTANEAKRIEQSFNDDAFRELVADYVTELADPKFRDEQEAYIRQMENNNELPSGKKLIRPNPGFVVKCTFKKNKGHNTSSDPNKLFLNMVYSDQVQMPTSTKKATNSTTNQASNNKESSSGTNWSVPYVIGPIRMEYDKSNNLVPTFDCCFHPLSLQYAHNRKEFCDLIIDIAKEAVKNGFENSGDEISIAEGYKILKGKNGGVSYKSGTPKALMIHAQNRNDGKRDDGEKNGVHTVERPLADSHSDEDPNDSKEHEITPKYEIVHQGVFDIANHTTQNSSPLTGRPKNICITIFLDEAEGAREITLDVSDKMLTLASTTESTHQYRLELPLPYSVNPDKGHAKFFKETKKMIVSLPVVPH